MTFEVCADITADHGDPPCATHGKENSIQVLEEEVGDQENIPVHWLGQKYPGSTLTIKLSKNKVSGVWGIMIDLAIDPSAPGVIHGLLVDQAGDWVIGEEARGQIKKIWGSISMASVASVNFAMRRRMEESRSL